MTRFEKLTTLAIVALAVGFFALARQHSPAVTVAPHARPIFAASINGNPIGGPGSTVNGQPVPPMPASPHYYVSNAGNDLANCQVLSAPCATVQQVFGRLGGSSWTGQPLVTLLNKLPVSANPVWNVPRSTNGGSPIFLQGTYVDSGLGTLTVSSGVQGLVPTTLATLTFPASTFTVSAQKGRVLNYLTGANSPSRAMIDSNSATVLTLTARLQSAAAGTDTVSISDLAGGLSFTGGLSINAPGGLIMDGVEITGDIVINVLGVVQMTAMRFISSNHSGVTFYITPMGGGAIYDDTLAGGYVQVLGTPAGLTACGSRYDGTAGGITLGNSPTNPAFGLFGQILVENMSMTGAAGLTGLCAGLGFDNLTLGISGLNVLTNAGIQWAGGVINAAGLNFGGTPTPFPNAVPAAVLSFNDVLVPIFSKVTVNGIAGSNNVFAADHSQMILSRVTGTNASAGVAFTVTHSNITVSDANTNTTLSGASASVDVAVGTNSAHSLAQVASTAADRIDTNTATYFGP